MTNTQLSKVPTAYGHRFASRRMAENYQFRPPYSPEVYSTLLGLIAPQCRTVLDAGCGTGKITLGLTKILGSTET